MCMRQTGKHAIAPLKLNINICFAMLIINYLNQAFLKSQWLGYVGLERKDVVSNSLSHAIRRPSKLKGTTKQLYLSLPLPSLRFVGVLPRTKSMQQTIDD